ncbi:MAG: diaminopimelate epimerase [archaeon]
MKLEFKKYHHCGNDFVIVDDLTGTIEPEFAKKLSKNLLKRKYAIGGNDLLYLKSDEDTDAFMHIYNVSDVEGSMCGNGSLCAGKYLSGKLGKNEIKIKTLSGIVNIKKIGNNFFELGLGQVFHKYGELSKFFKYPGLAKEESVLAVEFNIKEVPPFIGNVVHVGEPHLVVFETEVDKVDLQKFGDAVNNCKKHFPEFINLNLVQILDEKTIKIRTYERSCFEETDACATGSTCAAYVCKLLGNLKEDMITVKVKGGEFKVYAKKNMNYLVGSPEKVFEGHVAIPEGEF